MLEGANVLLGLLVLVVLVLILTNIRIISQGKAAVIERLGKYRSTWNAGIHIKIPFIDRVVRTMSLKEQVLDFPPQPVITKDNVTMMIDSVVFMKVFDPKMYTYGVENPMAGLQNLSATTLRSIIGDMELDQTLTSREVINGQMQKVLDEATDAWGIKVTRVEIKNIQPPKAIEEVMTKQMRAERERRQTVLEAQAHQEAVVSRAEGDKKAKILAAEAERDAQIALAEGKAKSIKLVYEAEANGVRQLNEANISDGVLKLKGIEALKDVADGRATKIFMPSDIASVVSSLGVAGEALGIGQAENIDKTPKPVKKAPKDPCISDETGKGGIEAAETTEAIREEMKNAVRKSNAVIRPEN
jgi:regulator of protease activity HflC (stomatin/prohibitin superfamily)